MKKTLKLLFVNPDTTVISTLDSAIEGFAIKVVAEHNLKQAYIVDTGIEVESDKNKK
jgi:hypothetical protein